MTPRHTFAALYFAGMTTGLCAGVMLPWWISGAPAYLLAWGVHDAAQAMLPWPPPCAEPSIRIAWSLGRDRHVRSAVWGAFIGALSGAVAADLQELYRAFGLTSRPLDGHACGAMAAALVLADAWLRGGDGGRPFSPGWRGVLLYVAFVLTTGVLPALAEVLS